MATTDSTLIRITSVGWAPLKLLQLIIQQIIGRNRKLFAEPLVDSTLSNQPPTHNARTKLLYNENNDNNDIHQRNLQHTLTYKADTSCFWFGLFAMWAAGLVGVSAGWFGHGFSGRLLVSLSAGWLLCSIYNSGHIISYRQPKFTPGGFITV